MEAISHSIAVGSRKGWLTTASVLPTSFNSGTARNCPGTHVLSKDKQGLLLGCQFHHEAGVVSEGPDIPLISCVEENGPLAHLPELIYRK